MDFNGFIEADTMMNTRNNPEAVMNTRNNNVVADIANIKSNAANNMPMAECCRRPLAQAFVCYQFMDEIYPPDKSLDRGTIFPELDIPYFPVANVNERRVK